MFHLQSLLENVESPDLLITTVDAMLLIIDLYPETFTGHFRDTVDILVGWHIDVTQQKPIVAYASRSLQKMRNFWLADLQFTLTLLGQFLEDMESYDEELSLPGSGRSSPGDESTPCMKECIVKITSLISVFNTVTKSILDHLNPNLNPAVQWSFLNDCLSKMLRIVVKAIEVDTNNINDLGISEENTESLIKCMKNMNLSQKNIETLLNNFNKDDLNEENLVQLIKSNITNKNDKKIDSIDKCIITKEKEESLLNLLKSLDLTSRKNIELEEKEELIVVANECAFLLLGHLQSRVTKNHDLLYKFIDLQLQRVNIFWDDTIVSTLTTISKVIKEVSANLPLELVHTLLGKNSILLKLRFSDTVLIQNASLAVYQSLLSLKNIPLLQEAYRYVLADLEIAYKLVVTDVENLVIDNPLCNNVSYKKKDAELVIIFLLRALSDIGNNFCSFFLFIYLL